MLLAEGMNVKVLLLPDGDDPDSFARKHSATEFQQYIADNEENFIRFKTNLLLKDTQNDPIKRAGLISDMARSIGLIPNEVIRYACLKECASILNVDEQIIQNEIKKIVRQRKDEYIEQRKKEKEEAEKVSAMNNAPQQEHVPDDGLIPPPPFPPEEVMEDVHESYIPQTGWEKLPFYTKEQQLIKALVRYGEQVVCYVENEDGEETPIRVTEYISMDLAQDGLQFQNPLHRQLLAEAEANLNKPNFCAERYFLAHPEPNISRMAADLISDRYRLSKSNEQALTKDEERLHDLIPHLLIDFKLSILEEDMKQTIQQLSNPDVAKNAQKSMEVMKHYKELTDTLKEMAKRAGDRVILKA
jgi:DNA primase